MLRMSLLTVGSSAFNCASDPSSFSVSSSTSLKSASTSQPLFSLTAVVFALALSCLATIEGFCSSLSAADDFASNTSTFSSSRSLNSASASQPSFFSSLTTFSSTFNKETLDYFILDNKDFVLRNVEFSVACQCVTIYGLFFFLNIFSS